MTPSTAAERKLVRSLESAGRGVVRAEESLDRKKHERDDRIRVAAGEGLSLRVIGDAVGLSHAGVKKILGNGAS